MEDDLKSSPPNLAGYLEDLQEETVKITAVFIGIVGYVWVFYNFWVVYINRYRTIPGTSWIGGWVLVLGAVLGFLLTKTRLQVKAYLISSCILVATVCAVLALASPSLIYLLVIPVIFAGVLIGQGGLAVAAIIVTVLAFQLSSQLLNTSPYLPVGAIALVAFATWLSERNLRTALTWTWNGYERARENQEIARERAGELQRTLKALDEATYRLERANYMLALARDQADEARRLKQQFAQTISHELRTPLNLIVGFTELMAETPGYYGVSLPPSYLRDLSTVYRNARHLQDLVNDVLDLARIEAAQMGMVPVEIDPVSLVDETVSTIRGLVEARGLRLEAQMDKDLPMLWIDPVRIRQILLNLINNAVRFTEEGGITVSVHRRAEDVVFEVSDTGIGIAAEDQNRIFDEFQQADGSTKRQHEGAGLGLAISKRFVELHGGHIWLQSSPGEGSTFYFSLPIKSQGWQDTLDLHLSHALADSTPTLSNGEDLILILVTPSPTAAALITRYVHGSNIITVSSIGEAKEAAKQLIPQVVVIDTACEKNMTSDVRDCAAAWDLPKTNFLAVPLPGEASRLRQLQIQGYLIKPVSRDSLWNTMRRFGEDIEHVLIVDDDRDFVRLLTRLLEDNLLRRYEVSAAFNGQQALSLAEQHAPDLILLDLGLPDISGLEVTERLRESASPAELPIVVVSAQESVDYHEPLPGTIATTRGEGFMPSEIVRWIQNMVDLASASSTRQS